MDEMSAQIVLTVTQGRQAGKEFVFCGQTQCVVGRARGCGVELPDDYTASRHHCLLDVNAPALAVQDLGSLNGTYVNGERRGGRRGRDGPAGETLQTCPPHPLHSGDELRVGGHVFRVEVFENAPDRRAAAWPTACA